MLAVSVGAMVWYERELRQRRAVPPWLVATMGIIYPASLGIDEGLAILSMRAATSMFTHCNTDGGGVSACNHWAFYTSASLWAIAGLATLPWLHVVYARHETTLALPIEYGAVQVREQVGFERMGLVACGRTGAWVRVRWGVEKGVGPRWTAKFGS